MDGHSENTNKVSKCMFRNQKNLMRLLLYEFIIIIIRILLKHNVKIII